MNDECALFGASHEKHEMNFVRSEFRKFIVRSPLLWLFYKMISKKLKNNNKVQQR